MGFESAPKAKSPEDIIRQKTVEGLRRSSEQRDLSEQMVRALIDKAQTPKQIAEIRKLLDEREKRLTEERR